MSGKIADRDAAIAKIRLAFKAMTPRQLAEVKRAEAGKAVNALPLTPVNTKKRAKDRHKPGYMTEYMRKRRAK